MIWVRFLGFLFSSLSLLAVCGASVLGLELSSINRELPDYSRLQSYEPAVMTRVYAADGSTLAEFAKQRRLFLPIQMVPRLLVDAFLSAEDKNFYSHPGIDPGGVVRAFVTNLRNRESRRPEGASTITQQVAKNFFLNNEVSYRRKLEEAVLAFRIEQTYSKDKILELYLNQIYLGSGNYGIAAAALNYFDKSVSDLTIAQMAYLAALPKAPNNYSPLHDHDAAVTRRNWVIEQMLHNGYITQAEADEAVKASLGATGRGPTPQNVSNASYFSEDVRSQLSERYGDDQLYEGGMSVMTTLDRHLQGLAHIALVDGLVNWDQHQGYRGPIANVAVTENWERILADQKQPDDVGPWQLAIVLETDANQARIGLRPLLSTVARASTRGNTGTIGLRGVAWARWANGPLKGQAVTRVSDVLKAGDVIYAQPSPDDDGTYQLRQVPEISGAIVVMDPFTGRVLAMDGGFSYQYSNFNRATQAYRQPGSSFKPFIYAAALDSGYTPSTIVSDSPVQIDPGGGQPLWSPENDGGKYYGPRTLRFGLEWSRNVMTVRVAQDIGMPLIAQYARRFGIYDDLPPYIAMSLGSGNTTLMRMVTAYAMLANGGTRIKPTLVDKIQDRWGHTIFRHDERGCPACNVQSWMGQDLPKLIDKRESVLDPQTDYQITSMLEGVVQTGTASVLKSLDRAIAGKTGTTNDSKDVWFIGYTPSLVAGVYIGYDSPRPLGRTATGGRVAAPVFGEFMQAALAGRPSEPFHIPPGIKLIAVDPLTGRRASGGEQALLEAFKVGSAPPDGSDYSGESAGPRSRQIVIGTGNLY